MVTFLEAYSPPRLSRKETQKIWIRAEQNGDVLGPRFPRTQQRSTSGELSLKKKRENKQIKTSSGRALDSTPEVLATQWNRALGMITQEEENSFIAPVSSHLLRRHRSAPQGNLPAQKSSPHQELCSPQQGSTPTAFQGVTQRCRFNLFPRRPAKLSHIDLAGNKKKRRGYY